MGEPRSTRGRPAHAELLRAGPGAVVILIAMALGSVVLWIGVPVGWLWVGSQVQGATGSVGAALGVAMVGAALSILVIAVTLGWLNNRYLGLAEARGIDTRGTSMLEYVLVVTAGLAVLCFTVWFVLFAGPGSSLAPTP